MISAVSRLLVALAAGTAASPADPVPWFRIEHETSGLVWDMSPSLAVEGRNRAMIRHWRIDPKSGRDDLLEQKLTGPFLPAATIEVRTLDPDGTEPRTRVDHAFSVHIHASGLLTDEGFPRSVSRVLLERQLVAGDPAQTPSSSRAWIDRNGSTVLKFPASGLTAGDPTKADGHETFLIHALAGDRRTEGPIATAKVRVLPVASGRILGLRQGELVNRRAPKVELVLNDLYPKSATHLLLYEGREIHGNPSITVKSLVIDQKNPLSTRIRVDDFSALMPTNGLYTIALVSDTVYGRELLCDPVTFEIQRPPRMNGKASVADLR
jgi:hypothetical protein